MCYGRSKANFRGRAVLLKVETEEDWWEVEGLFDLSFAPGREALSSYRLRDGTKPVRDLCLTARGDDGILGGAIRFWPVWVGGMPALLLGPVAVHPTRQGEGVGGLLIEGALAKATEWERVMLVGDAPYYGRFGFAPLVGVRMPPPTNPDRVLGRDLVEGAWNDVRGKVTAWQQGPLPLLRGT